MRILFLCKRRYMGKDLLADRYGRFFELPELLARRGHTIVGLTLNYHGTTTAPRDELLTPAGVRWRSLDLLPWPPGAWLRYRRLVAEAVAELRPEVIVGASDAFHLIFASRLGRRHGLPVLADLYDHFDAYPATWTPGVRAGLRRALTSADGVTCVSRALGQWCARLRGSADRVHLLPNGVIAGQFRPLDGPASRAELGLPPQALLVGTAGALTVARDIRTLYRAFATLSREVPRAHLVVAGRRDVAPPRGANVSDLGQLPHQQVPALFAALDVGVVCNTDSLFARYCDPQKLVEMRACGLPVVVADTFAGALEPQPGAVWLYVPGQAASLAAQLRQALELERRPAPPEGIAWADRAAALEEILRTTIRPRRAADATCARRP